MNQELSAPIFIHSLFRTGSTWLFDRFRQAEGQGFWCYQEPFHEMLINLKDQPELVLGISGDTSTSLRHPALDKPYFYEFYAIREHIGDSFQKCISFDSFFDSANCTAFDKYIGKLIRYAQGRPVLQCCRSFGRVKHIRQHHGGMHIYLWRNPWDQWWSYQINDYFDTASLAIINAHNAPNVIALLRSEIGLEEVREAKFIDEYNRLINFSVSVENRYLVFYTLWLFSLLENRSLADCEINIDSLTNDPQYLAETDQRFNDFNINGIGLSSCDVPQAKFEEEDKKFFIGIEHRAHKLFASSGYSIEDLHAVIQLQRAHQPATCTDYPKLTRDGQRARAIALRFANSKAEAQFAKDHAVLTLVDVQRAHKQSEAHLVDELQEDRNRLGQMVTDAQARENVLREEFQLEGERLKAEQRAQQQALLERERQFAAQIAELHAQAQQARDQAAQHLAQREAELGLTAQAQLAELDDRARRDIERLQSELNTGQHALLERERQFASQLAEFHAVALKARDQAELDAAQREAEIRAELAAVRRTLEQTRLDAYTREAELDDRARRDIERLQSELKTGQHALRERERLFASQIAELHAQAQQARDQSAQHHAQREAELRAELAVVRQTLEQARAEAQSREAEAHARFDAHIAQVRADVAAHTQTNDCLVAHLHAQESILRTDLAQYAAYAQALAGRISAMQSTWWWRLSMLWRMASHWATIPSPAPWLGGLHAPVGEFAPMAAAPQAASTTSVVSVVDSALVGDAELLDLDLPEQEGLTMPIQNITELFSLDGRAFITEAYRNLLQREPDLNGMAYYLGRLSMGYGKARVIVQLAKSAECRPHEQIHGLKRLIQEHNNTNHWLWGWFSRHTRMHMALQSSVTALARIEQRMAGIHHAINAQSQQMENLARQHAESLCGIESLVLQTMGDRAVENKQPRLPTETVRQVYREILGREPENDDVIHHHAKLGTSEALRESLLNSDEFSGRQAALPEYARTILVRYMQARRAQQGA